jgi:excisionase family DNA binding protein
MPPLLTIADLAAYLKLSKPTIRKAVARGELPPPIRFGRACRWKPEDVQEALGRRAGG